MENVTLEMVYQAVQEVNRNLANMIPHLQLIPYIYVSAAITVGMFLGLIIVIKKMFLLEERLLSMEMQLEKILEKLEKEEEKELKEIEEIEKITPEKDKSKK